MNTYQINYLCLMCLFIVVLLVGVLVLLINHFKEHKRFLCKMDNTMQEVKKTAYSIENNGNIIWSAASKMRDDVHTMRERIVTEPAKPIDPVDIPIWVADPCPGCGYKPVVLPVTDNRDAMVYCKNCNEFGYTAGGETVRGAVYMWNKTVAEYLTKINAEKEKEDGGNNE